MNELWLQETWVKYKRKSTDRDDKQTNSIEHQDSNCNRTAINNNIEIIKDISESKSAKTEWTREWFNDLIKICKTWKVDYIIIDEPKRLSRNNIDTSRVIDLMDKQLVKWILCTSRTYMSNNSRDKFLLQLDLSLSKMDNEDRSKDTKEKMETCMRNTWRFLWLAPFWYKNITIKKGHRDIVIEPKEAKIVKKIFELRVEWNACSTIARILKEKYDWKIKFSFTKTRVQKLLKSKFYYGMFTWNGQEHIWKHKAIISKEIYDKANSIWKWVHEKIQTIQSGKSKNYYFKWFVKDLSWNKLASYTKKWNTYYYSYYYSEHKVSISEKLLFEKVERMMKDIDWYFDESNNVYKEMVLKILEDDKTNNLNDIKVIESKIIKLNSRQDKLLDLQLDDKISNDIYLSKNNQIENEIKWLEEEKCNLKNENFIKKTRIVLELAGSFYRSYCRANLEWKIFIIKKLTLELLVDTKKELQIKESPLLKSSKLLKNSYGVPNSLDIRKFRQYLMLVNLKDLQELQNFIKKL